MKTMTGKALNNLTKTKTDLERWSRQAECH